MTCGRWPRRSTGGLKCGDEWGAVEDVAAVGDLAVLDGDPLGTGSAFHRPGFGVVHDERGFIVTEGGDHFRAGEDLQERALETAVRLGAFQAAGRRVADDVVGDVAHGRVQVVIGPGLVVGQPGLQRGTGGICHGDFPFVSGISSYLVLCTLRCTHAGCQYATLYACRRLRSARAANEARSPLTTWSPPPSTSSTETASTR